jgi:hypothetical protein
MKSTKELDQMVAPFLLAEFEALTNRILNIEQTRATRINFYLAIMTAAIGGLLVISQIQAIQIFYLIVASAFTFIVFLLGVATLNEYIELASHAVFLYRRAGRVRCWFHDKNPSILPYLAWTPGDDTPPFMDEPGYATFAGKDSILWMGNSLSGAAFAFTFTSIIVESFSNLPLIVSFATFILIWVLQNVYLRQQIKKYERIGSEKTRIHFPRVERTFKHQIKTPR